MAPPAHDGRHRILEAAQRITFSRGLSALRVSELAYNLGMSKKKFYAYYPSKEALLAKGEAVNPLLELRQDID
jgi:AcrR family transcriptional regulator